MTDARPWALAFIRALRHRGVTHACASPGARSTPIALALHATEGLSVSVHHDERTAAFFALGIARTSGRPVVLVCTSGSAATHWFPAVVEASADDIPLLLLTADRPAELQDCGAPQAMDQQRLFGQHVRAFLDPGAPWTPGARVRTPAPSPLDHITAVAQRAVDTATRAPRPGPVHVNLPFREPLEPETLDEALPLPHLPSPAPISCAAPAPNAAGRATLAEWFSQARHPVLLAGPHACPTTHDARAVLDLARLTGATIVTDVLSGLRTGPHASAAPLLHAPELTLDTHALPATDALVLAGRTFTARAPLLWRDPRRTLPHLLLDPAHRHEDPLRAPSTHAPITLRDLRDALATSAPAAHDSSEVVPAPAGRLDALLDEALDAGDLSLAGATARLVLRSLADGDLLHVASSMPIRDVDTFGGTTPRLCTITASRGLNGIDGMVATALGCRVALPAPGRVVALIGDVAALHDLGGMLALPQAGGPVTLVVVNNDGGAIFDTLPTARFPEVHDRFLRTPHGRTLEGVAGVMGMRYVRAESPAEVRRALGEERAAEAGCGMIEVVVDGAADMRARREAVRRLGEAWRAEAAGGTG